MCIVYVLYNVYVYKMKEPKLIQHSYIHVGMATYCFANLTQLNSHISKLVQIETAYIFYTNSLTDS